ncbi:MAG: hypothetical protein KDD10_30045 [Phaeodactylibacter sp.]|nr:hypothetical protein [Phaeodactylibacter sp.]MCB9292663.1 hypothetical protein [Lewinellaceae bacterium]
MAGQANILIKDLSNVPSIIGALGLSISAAQKAFNLEYLENLEKMITMAKRLLGQEGMENNQKFQEFNALISNMVLTLAPTRYQFTETTLSVRLDLAQTMSKGEQVGLGVNMGAVAVNAAMTSAFGFDYRAAAEVKTVLQAVPPDVAAFKALLGRAAMISNDAIALPSPATVDQNIIDTTERIFNKLVDTTTSPLENND